MTRKISGQNKPAAKKTAAKSTAAPVEKQKTIGEPTDAMLAAAEGVMRSGQFSGLGLVAPTIAAMVKAPGALAHGELHLDPAFSVSIRNGQSNVTIAREWYAAVCRAA